MFRILPSLTALSGLWGRQRERARERDGNGDGWPVCLNVKISDQINLPVQSAWLSSACHRCKQEDILLCFSKHFDVYKNPFTSSSKAATAAPSTRWQHTGLFFHFLLLSLVSVSFDETPGRWVNSSYSYLSWSLTTRPNAAHWSAKENCLPVFSGTHTLTHTVLPRTSWLCMQ